VTTATALRRSETSTTYYATLGSATRLTVLSAGTVILVTTILGISHLWTVVLGNAHRIPAANLTISLALILFALGIPFGLGQRILSGLGRNEIAVLIQGASGPLQLAVTGTVTVTGGPVSLYILGPATGLAASALIASVVAQRLAMLDFHEIMKGARTASGSVRKGVRNHAGPMLVVMLAMPIGLQTDRLILSHTSSPLQLADYSLAAQTASPMLGVILAAASPLWTIFARQRARSETEVGLSLKRTLCWFALGSIALGVILLILGGWLGRVISHGEIHLSKGLLGGFALLIVAYSLNAPLGMYLTTVEGLRFQARCSTVMAVINLPLSYIFAVRFGATGPVVASAVAIGASSVIPMARRALR
jgi:O-antigen/teichoic acid export membrane protein